MFEIFENDGSQDELLSLISAASIIDLGVQHTGVGITAGMGCTYTANMDIDIAGGYYAIFRQAYAFSAQSVTISAGDATYDRIDIIEVDNTGTVVVIEGTPADPPREPARTMSGDVPTNVKLCMVLVKANDSTSLSASGTPIADRRVFANTDPLMLNGPTAPVGADGVDGDWYMATNTNTLYGPKAAGAWPTGVPLNGPLVTVDVNWTANDGVPAGTPASSRVLRRKW